MIVIFVCWRYCCFLVPVVVACSQIVLEIFIALAIDLIGLYSHTQKSEIWCYLELELPWKNLEGFTPWVFWSCCFDMAQQLVVKTCLFYKAYTSRRPASLEFYHPKEYFATFNQNLDQDFLFNLWHHRKQLYWRWYYHHTAFWPRLSWLDSHLEDWPYTALQFLSFLSNTSLRTQPLSYCPFSIRKSIWNFLPCFNYSCHLYHHESPSSSSFPYL